jgi:hypothetical protein
MQASRAALWIESGVGLDNLPWDLCQLLISGATVK